MLKDAIMINIRQFIPNVSEVAASEILLSKNAMENDNPKIVLFSLLSAIE